VFKRLPNFLFRSEAGYILPEIYADGGYTPRNAENSPLYQIVAVSFIQRLETG